MFETAKAMRGTLRQDGITGPGQLVWRLGATVVAAVAGAIVLNVIHKTPLALLVLFTAGLVMMAWGAIVVRAEATARQRPPVTLSGRAMLLHRQASEFFAERERQNPQHQFGPDPPPDRTQPGGGQEWLDALRAKSHRESQIRATYDWETFELFHQRFGSRIVRLVDDVQEREIPVDPRILSRYQGTVNLNVARQLVSLIGAMGEQLGEQGL